jgi:photosystem II CP47 chlorophyll apoprotein
MSAVLPWFRVHIVILNDPGRLISSHIMHTALVAGWSALMLLYELGFGLAHLTGFLGPGMWTSDSLNLVGSIRFVKASFNLLAYARLAYGVISSHHIISGLLGTSIGLWHITLRPLAYLYNLLSMGKVESILSSSITAVFFTAFLISALMWYGSAHTTQELFGPTRYSWDNAYYSLDIRTSCSNAWNTLPDKLVLYDYIGSNPAKGGLFRSGPMLKADGLVQNWLGHAASPWVHYP